MRRLRGDAASIAAAVGVVALVAAGIAQGIQAIAGGHRTQPSPVTTPTTRSPAGGATSGPAAVDPGHVRKSSGHNGAQGFRKAS